MKRNSKTIGLNKLVEILNVTDLTARIIKSHLVIEFILNAILKEAIVTNQTLELKKLSFNLKVDLCFALVPMDAEFKPFLLKINKIRNDFAHNNEAKFDDQEARDLLNIAPIEYKNGMNCFKDANTSMLIWHACFYACFIYLNVIFNKLIDFKVSQEVYGQEIDELLKEYKLPIKKLPTEIKVSNNLTKQKIKSKIQEKFKNYLS